MMEASDECRMKISDLRQALSGTLRIGVTHSFSHLLPEPVKIFLRAHPGVRLKIFYKTASELIDMLLAGTVDFIITFKPSMDYECISWESILMSQLSAVMWDEHPLADRKMLTVNDISRYGIILPSAGHQSRKVFDRFTNVDTSALDVKVEIDEPNIILDMLYGTQMIAILSSLATRFHKSLVAVPVEEFQQGLTGCVQWLNTTYKKRSVNAFLEIFRESLL
ncbi:MAG: LysR family transcriptional regulator substrate-binding protein [Bacteroidia bacterium]|nr:LysR family transcriptional regulator substrate-binding protein [Bacteroidia bacterium]